MGTEAVSPPQGCTGIECYEVFTCRGFAATTEHLRQPLMTITGAVIFPMGVVAALHGYRSELRLVVVYLAVLTAIYIGCLFGDIVYYNACDAYPSNAIQQTLLWPIAFPLRAATQEQISKLTFFPREVVDKITSNFATMFWYLVMELFICAFLVYTVREIRLLALLFECGPLGMGVHYGLDQFDEVLNHELIQKRKEPKSKFVEDAQLPLESDVEAPLAYHVGHNYGAFHGKSARLAAGPSKDVEEWKERRQEVEEEMAYAESDLAKAKEAYHEANFDFSHEKEEEAKQEFEAMDKFRENEMHDEAHQERRAEELAEYAADEAAREAESQGMSPQEVWMVRMNAYQHKLSKHHRMMLEMTKARTLHQHYRHAEREQHYHEMEEEVAHKVEHAQSDIQEAQQRMQNAQDARRSLEAEKERLVQQNMWQEPTAAPEYEADSFPEPTTLPPAAGAALASPVEFGQGFGSLGYAPASMAYPPPPPTFTMGTSVSNTAVMGPVPTTSAVTATSGTFGGTANFGSGPLLGAVPSTLPPAALTLSSTPTSSIQYPWNGVSYQ
jgi:hypothetical protein